jgi:hypothetical protein
MENEKLDREIQENNSESYIKKEREREREKERDKDRERK